MTTETATRPPLSEAALQRQIIEAARWLNWTLCYHTRYSIGSTPGFPDLILLREGALLAIEVKGPRGTVKPEQQGWIELLNTVPGVRAIFAWPDNWEEVEDALRQDQPGEVWLVGVAATDGEEEGR